MNENIRTILFDLDGTLINTNELIIESFKYTFKQYGFNFTEEEIIQFNGPPLLETFQKIDHERAEEMIGTYREHNFYYHDEYVTAFPHVIDTIKTLYEHNFDLGIVSTKMRSGVDKGLEITGLRSYFSSIVTLDDVVHAKPDSEPVLTGMEQLKGKRESTIMIGDNSHDIESGHNAGVQTAGVAWAQRGEAFLQHYQPTYMLKDIRDLLSLVLVSK